MELVILVDEQNNELGVMEKMQAHQTPILHRAFSIFIFNDKNEMLLQQRAVTKYHSPNLWTNACCSHPKPNEIVEQAANRRLTEELGFTTNLKEAFAFTYQASFENGLYEYEYDHVFTGIYNGTITPNPQEVQSYAYYSLATVSEMLQQQPQLFTAWFAIAFPKLLQHINQQIK